MKNIYLFAFACIISPLFVAAQTVEASNEQLFIYYLKINKFAPGDIAKNPYWNNATLTWNEVYLDLFQTNEYKLSKDDEFKKNKLIENSKAKINSYISQYSFDKVFSLENLNEIGTYDFSTHSFPIELKYIGQSFRLIPMQGTVFMYVKRFTNLDSFDLRLTMPEADAGAFIDSRKNKEGKIDRSITTKVIYSFSPSPLPLELQGNNKELVAVIKSIEIWGNVKNEYKKLGLVPRKIYRHIDVGNCGSITVTHTAGAVSPLTKTITYATITSNELLGENMCWLAKNLGAESSPSSSIDGKELSTGWYWQFNQKQGYKQHPENSGRPDSWLEHNDQNSDWARENDPCSLLLGNGWHVPTTSEWKYVYNANNWHNYNDAYNSLLKLNAGGFQEGTYSQMTFVGSQGRYWSSNENKNGWQGEYLLVDGGSPDFGFHSTDKREGNLIRCVKNLAEKNSIKDEATVKENPLENKSNLITSRPGSSTQPNGNKTDTSSAPANKKQKLGNMILNDLLKTKKK